MQAGVAILLGLLLAVPMSQAVPATPPVSAAPAGMSGQIAGRVTVEGANTPLSGARVSLIPTSRPTGPMGPPAQALTDQDGRFVFNRVAPGSYRMSVQKTGFAPLNEPGRDPATQVNAGQTTEIALRLQVGAVISGKILDASGEPVSDLRVMAMHRINGNAPGAAAGRLIPAPGGGQQTNDLGEFRIASLAPGEYYVAAMPRGLPFGGPAVTPTANATTNVTTYYPGTLDQAAAQTVKVAAGETVNNIAFSMQSAPAFRVSGRVVDENGAPVAGAMVMLMSDPRGNAFMGPMGNARTGDDGRFTFGEVPSGAYRVNASVPVLMNGSAGAASGGVQGGVSGGSYSSYSWSIGSGPGGAGAQPAEVIVDGANVTGVRVVVHRPAPQ
jgi:protocatechuate 3,4-dioxygenase beta subunit